MTISIDLQRDVQSKLAQWGTESAIHFCRLARSGAEFTNVIYPTGMRTVIAKHGAEQAEVGLLQAKSLRAAGYKIVP